MSNRSKVLSLLKKIGIALGITLFFSFLAAFSGIGYHGKASLILPFKEGVLEGQYSYRIVTYSCNVSFNPFLYPLSWLQGKGHISDIFKMVYLPQSYGSPSSDVYPYYPSGAYWGTHRDMEQEGLMNVVFSQLTLLNALYLFIIIFVIELFGKHGLLLCLLGGTVGFALGGLFGSVVGFVIGALIFVFLILIIKETQWLQRILYPKEKRPDS